MFSIVYQRVSLKLCCVCCGRAGGNGRHSLDAFALKTSPPPPPPPFLLLISILLSLPVNSRSIERSSPPVVFGLKTMRFVRSCPKKVEKTSSENLTFENWRTPMLAVLPASFFRSRFLPYVSFVF